MYVELCPFKTGPHKPKQAGAHRPAHFFFLRMIFYSFSPSSFRIGPKLQAQTASNKKKKKPDENNSPHPAKSQPLQNHSIINQMDYILLYQVNKS